LTSVLVTCPLPCLYLPLDDALAVSTTMHNETSLASYVHATCNFQQMIVVDEYLP
jgi:hypothetical protein